MIAEIERGMIALRDAGFDSIDYLALCDAESLAPLVEVKTGGRLLAAVRLGRTRLIDNLTL